MITVTQYAYVSGKWMEQHNFTRPFQGADKLDETLDSAVMDFTLQEQPNTMPPFTEFKIVADDGTTNKTRYFVIGGSKSTKARMGG